MCNLSSVIVKEEDTLKDLEEKVVTATIIGTLQSTLTDFKYLRKIWKDNAEEERLLGVSLTGIMDHPVLNGSRGYEELKIWLAHLKAISKKTNEEFAEKLNINKSKQITLVKPEGTVSLLCSTSSGIHPRFSEYYYRRVTQDNKDPLTQLMIDEGIPYNKTNSDKTVFSFVVKSPENSRVEITTIEQLDIWKIYRDYWCDGNPSQSIYYNDDTFLELQAWIWGNWDSIGGLSFFPKDDNIYENNPFESISKEEYEEFLSNYPENVNWNKISEYEKEDNSVLEVAAGCSGGKCEL